MCSIHILSSLKFYVRKQKQIRIFLHTRRSGLMTNIIPVTPGVEVPVGRHSRLLLSNHSIWSCPSALMSSSTEEIKLEREIESNNKCPRGRRCNVRVMSSPLKASDLNLSETLLRGTSSFQVLPRRGTGGYK